MLDEINMPEEKRITQNQKQFAHVVVRGKYFCAYESTSDKFFVCLILHTVKYFSFFKIFDQLLALFM